MKIKWGNFEFESGKTLDSAVLLFGALLFYWRGFLLFQSFFVITSPMLSLSKEVALRAVGASELDWRMVLTVIFTTACFALAFASYLFAAFLKRAEIFTPPKKERTLLDLKREDEKR